MKTRFDIEQEVWYLEGTKVYNDYVHSIVVDNDGRIYYNLSGDQNRIPEYGLFATREEAGNASKRIAKENS